MFRWKVWVKKLAGKLIITPWEKGVLSVILEDRKALEIAWQAPGSDSRVGNIYVARVEKIVKNLNAAFLTIEEGITGYFPLGQRCAIRYTKKGASEHLQQGDELLVQVVKDEHKTKRLSLTCELSLSGKYLVAMPGSNQFSISHKLDPEERARWQAAMEPFLHQGIGWIIRTNAQNASQELVMAEASQLMEQCKRILDTAGFRKAGTCLYHTIPSYMQFLKNRSESEMNEIWTDSEQLYREMRAYLDASQPTDLSRLRLYQDSLQPLSKKYSLEIALQEALQPRVWLKSGGYLVIQQTEALAVIDVNSGKCISKKHPEDLFLRVNLEAAREVARQIRLRNLSGIIIVDFINLKEEAHIRELLDVFRRELLRDPEHARLVDITPLGLVEVTRACVRPTLEEMMRSGLG